MRTTKKDIVSFYGIWILFHQKILEFTLNQNRQKRVVIVMNYDLRQTALKISPILALTTIFILGTTSTAFAFDNPDNYEPSVSFDRYSYPVPFGAINDFEDITSSLPENRSIFPMHKSAIDTGKLQEFQTLDTGDLTLHIRVHDPNYNTSLQEIDEIAQDIQDKAIGPLKISISRDSQKMVLAYAGGSTPNKNGLVDVGDNNPDNTRQLGPISEVAPDAGIFELDFVIRYTDGPSSAKCPTTAIFTSLDEDVAQDNEKSRFDALSPEKEEYCILKGDMLTVEYSHLDTSGNVLKTITDSATFELRDGLLKSDKSTYMIGSDMILTLVEPDFDLDNDVAETYDLDLIEWDSDAATLTLGFLGGETTSFDPEPMALRETGDSSGIFQIVVEIPEKLYDDHLERGEEIVLEYTDWGPSSADYIGQKDKDSNWTIFTSNFGATIELDKKVYLWTDKVHITVNANDHNFDSDLIDDIGNSEQYPITISTRDFTLDKYKLIETGTNTGIFKGQVSLFANVPNSNNMATGTGPTDGLIPANHDNDDGITITFEFSEDETVVGSALIRSDAQMEMSPLKQIKSGVLPGDVVCYKGLLKMYQHDGSIACVKLDSISKLMERGWNRN